MQTAIGRKLLLCCKCELNVVTSWIHDVQKCFLHFLSHWHYEKITYLLKICLLLNKSVKLKLERSSYSCCPDRLRNEILGMHWKGTWLESRNVIKEGNTVSTHFCKFHTLCRHQLVPLLQFGFSNYSNILHKHFLQLDVCVCVHIHIPISCLECPPCLFCLWEYGCLMHPQSQGMLRGKCWPDYSRAKARKHLVWRIT